MEGIVVDIERVRIGIENTLLHIDQNLWEIKGLIGNIIFNYDNDNEMTMLYYTMSDDRISLGIKVAWFCVYWNDSEVPICGTFFDTETHGRLAVDNSDEVIAMLTDIDFAELNRIKQL